MTQELSTLITSNLQVVLDLIVGIGIITIIFQHGYDKKLKGYEIKLGKYLEMSEQISDILSGLHKPDKFATIMNSALIFSSDKVVKEIQKFNQLYTKKQKKAVEENVDFEITTEDFKPLIIAIRKDLYLKSKSIKKGNLRIFKLAK